MGSAPTRAALVLGHGGLLPFVGGAAWLIAGPPETRDLAARVLTAYAATIVAFLGGIHWGLAFAMPGGPTTARLGWGVVPSLIAWVAVMMPPSAGLVVHGAALLLCYAVDRRVYPRHGLQRWLTLRFRLSAVAALSCFVGAAGT